MKHKITEILGEIRVFNGIFNLYKTDNIFQFIKQTPQDMSKDILDDISGEKVCKFGKIQPKVKINSEGMIVGILNKKEGLFVCKKYPMSVFKFLIK